MPKDIFNCNNTEKILAEMKKVCVFNPSYSLFDTERASKLHIQRECDKLRDFIQFICHEGICDQKARKEGLVEYSKYKECDWYREQLESQPCYPNHASEEIKWLWKYAFEALYKELYECADSAKNKEINNKYKRFYEKFIKPN